jgi:hypothetical protein
VDLKELARILNKIFSTPPSPPPKSGAKAPQWLVDLLSVPPEPRYPDSSRVVPQHLRNASTAAWHLAEPGVLTKDPGALKRYLVEWLGWKELDITREHEYALYLEITEELEPEELERPIGKKTSWLASPDKTVRELHVRVRRRARALRKDGLRLSPREKERRKKWNKKVLPEKIAEETAKVAAFAVRGEEDEFLRQARNVLSNKQFRVLDLRRQGRSTKEIASELGVKEATVYVYYGHIRQNPWFRELVEKWTK